MVGILASIIDGVVVVVCGTFVLLLIAWATFFDAIRRVRRLRNRARLQSSRPDGAD